VRTGKSHLLRGKITLPDSQLALCKGAGDVVDNLRRNARPLAHLRLHAVHLIKPGQKLRLARRILLQSIHPADRQIHGFGIGLGNLLHHQGLRFLDQRRPEGGQSFAFGSERQLL